MKKMHSKSKNDTGIIGHIGLGILISLICAVLLSIVLAVMIEKEIIAVDAAPSFAVAIHAISVFIGSIISLSFEKGRIAMIAGVVATSYLLLLLCINMLIYSSGFAGLGGGVISAYVGSLLAVMIKSKISGKNKRRTKVRSR